MLASLRRIRLGILLNGLFGLLTLMLLGYIGSAIHASVNELRQANHALATVRASSDLFATLQYLRPERGPTRTALGADDPADPALLAGNANHRAKSGPLFNDLVAACERLACAEGIAPADLRAAMQKLDAVRVEVDAALRLPKSQRRADIAQDFNTKITAVIDALETMAKSLTAQVRLTGSVMAEQAAIKDTAYVVRDAAGLERNLIESAMIAKAISPELQAKMAHFRGQVDAGWRLLGDLVSRPGMPENVVSAVKQAEAAYFGDFLKQRDAIEKAIAAGTPLPMSRSEMVRLSNVGLDALMAVPQAALETMTVRAGERHDAARAALLLNAGLLLATLATLAVAFLIVRRWIVGPIVALTAGMKRLAGGDTETAIPVRDRGDEIGAMAATVEVFKVNAVERLRLEAVQAAEDVAKARRAETIDRLIGGFDADVSGILRTVASASTELESTAQAMTATASESSEKATSVAAASEQASNNVRTVASAAEEMAASIREISQQVATSQRIAQQANEEAEHTNGTVAGLVTAARKIGDVVDLISAIASQTNLLALNATIEAARAGEAGKGFAVVASEVKSLAAQTAKATGEIAAQVEAIQSVSGEAAQAIQGIGGTVGQVNEIATSIAAAMEQQGAATQEIARNVQQAAQGTAEVSSNIVAVTAAANETGAAAGQVLGASGELSRQAEDLKAKIERFLDDIRAA